jgi:hypothetical protein
MPTNISLKRDTHHHLLLIVSAFGWWGLRVVPPPVERSGKIAQAVMYRFKGAHITPRAAVLIDHGRLVRNLINISKQTDIVTSARGDFFDRVGFPGGALYFRSFERIAAWHVKYFVISKAELSHGSPISGGFQRKTAT